MISPSGVPRGKAPWPSETTQSSSALEPPAEREVLNTQNPGRAGALCVFEATEITIQNHR